MSVPKLGEISQAVSKALDGTSAPKLAEVAGCGTQSIYNYRDGMVPSRMAIPGLARAIGISEDTLRGMVARAKKRANRCRVGVA